MIKANKTEKTMEKVWVLTCQYSLNDSSGLDVQVFNSMKKAQAEMKNDFTNTVKEFGYSERELHDDCAALYEKGYYSMKHAVWEIYECKVR